jgi:hypothetical protein
MGLVCSHPPSPNRNALLAAHTASADALEAKRLKQTIQQLESVVAAQKDEIRALEGRLDPNGGELSAFSCGCAFLT